MHDAVAEPFQRGDGLAAEDRKKRTVNPMRSPVRITGKAAGSSTWRNICTSEAPIERAAVMNILST